MPHISYTSINYRANTLELIQRCQEIIAEYAPIGLDLTVRQLYYQLVSRAYIPNNEKSYRHVVNTVSDARMTGDIDWNSIVDRTRNVRSNPHWSHPGEILRSAAHQFQYDKWLDQAERVEVWIEKDALTGVIAGVCNELDVPYFSCRGYTSQSEIWRGAQRVLEHHRSVGQGTVILHMGDLDPSGVDMTRDITDRLEIFTSFTHGDEFTVERIALNESQVARYKPPPNPAKLTDSRIDSYIEVFGYQSWELDALDPTVLVALVRDKVGEYRDDDLWNDNVLEEEKAREQLSLISDNFDDVALFVQDTFGEGEK